MSSFFRVWEYLSSKWWFSASFHHNVSESRKNPNHYGFKYDFATHVSYSEQKRNSNPISYLHSTRSLHVFNLFRFRSIPASIPSSKINLIFLSLISAFGCSSGKIVCFNSISSFKMLCRA